MKRLIDAKVCLYLAGYFDVKPKNSHAAPIIHLIE